MWEYCVSLSCSYALVQFGRYLGRIITLMDNMSESEPKDGTSGLEWDDSYDNPEIKID